MHKSLVIGEAFAYHLFTHMVSLLLKQSIYLMTERIWLISWLQFSTPDSYLYFFFLYSLTENQHYDDIQPNYVPTEMVRSCSPNDTPISYHCYLIELNQNFVHEISVCDVVVGMRIELEPDVVNTHFDLKVDRGNITVSFKYVGIIHLNSQQVISHKCVFAWCLVFCIRWFFFLGHFRFYCAKGSRSLFFEFLLTTAW